VTCASGKRRWAKRSGAHRHAKFLTRTNRHETAGGRRRAETTEYRCAECDGWHVFTQQDMRERRVA
jgi:hypothetical protein